MWVLGIEAEEHQRPLREREREIEHQRPSEIGNHWDKAQGRMSDMVLAAPVALCPGGGSGGARDDGFAKVSL